MRASMSVPAAVSSVEIDGRMLVDGGISNNLPMDVAREMGADRLIVVDVSTPLLEREALNSAVSVVTQLSSFLTRRNSLQQLETLTDDDILIVPELKGVSSSDFKNTDVAINAGRIAAASALQDTVFERPVYAPGSEFARETAPKIVPEFVRLENNTELADEFIMARLDVTPGEVVDFDALDRRIETLYGLDVFNTIDYRVVIEGERTGLVFSVSDKPWDPNFVQFGLQFSSNLDAGNDLALRLGFTQTAITPLNGEWRTVLQ